MNVKHTLIIASIALCPLATRAERPTIYFNGDTLTMEGDSPRYVEAVVVKGDKIAFAGDLREARDEAGRDHEIRDLQGHTLLRGFIDTLELWKKQAEREMARRGLPVKSVNVIKPAQASNHV